MISPFVVGSNPTGGANNIIFLGQRHFRIAHLINEYDFTPYQITAYTGWSLKSTFGAIGGQTSNNLDAYTHLQ